MVTDGTLRGLNQWSTGAGTYACIFDATTKFQTITEPIHKYCTKIEDKINRLLSKLKKEKCINDTIYSNLYISSSGPGTLYGLPKVQMTDFASKFRYHPILTAYNQASYNISKFLVSIVAPLTANKYTVTNSNEFARIISNQQNTQD